jgi:predicted nucleic acid-binding protein
VSFLLDTNVLSELRKGSRTDAGVQTWFEGTNERELFTSVLVLGEIRRGIEVLRRRDATAAEALDQWQHRLVETFGDRILPIDAKVADQWGALNVSNPVATVDGLLAATAIVRGFTLVTRNVKDFKRTGVCVLNPFGEH